jgi:hypothetical protein
MSTSLLNADPKLDLGFLTLGVQYQVLPWPQREDLESFKCLGTNFCWWHEHKRQKPETEIVLDFPDSFKICAIGTNNLKNFLSLTCLIYKMGQ